MRVIGHITTSLTAGGILYYYSRSLVGFFWLLAVGVFMDLDHYIDYARERGISFNLVKIYNACKEGYLNFKKLTLILHSYELAILLWLAIFVFDLDHVWIYAATGLTLHIFIDQVINPVLPFSYFLWFRLVNNFETRKVFAERGVGYARWYG